MRTYVLIIVGLLTTLLTACQGIDTAADNQDSIFDSWTLTQSDALNNIPDNILLTFNNSDAKGIQVNGFSGVNRVMGGASVANEHKLSFGALVSTRMMGPEPRMSFEAKYLKLLQSVTHYQLENDQLTLTSKDGKKLVFKRGVH